MASIALAQPNSIDKLHAEITTGHVTWSRTITTLFIRIVLFAAWQAIVAIIFALQGASDPWAASIAWWPITVTLTNVICLPLLNTLMKREGASFLDLLNFSRPTLWRDLLIAFGLTFVLMPIAFIPNLGFANLLFGTQQTAIDLFVKSLPLWAAIVGVTLFPITQGLAELTTYFGYVMPRWQALSQHKWQSIVIPALLLAAQHCAVPLIFDWRFIAWRFLMFVPFALSLAIALKWRPSLMPYFMIGHALIDLPMGMLVLSLSVPA